MHCIIFVCDCRGETHKNDVLMYCHCIIFVCDCRGETHKNDVLMYCQKKARQCRDDESQVDRESAELLWKYLQLLIKQNGVCMQGCISRVGSRVNYLPNFENYPPIYTHPSFLSAEGPDYFLHSPSIALPDILVISKPMRLHISHCL